MTTLSLLKNRPLTILVVEDDDELREILQAEFELEGLTAVTATNGSEAVTTAQRLKPDLILMDVMMPVMDGIEATKIVKGNEQTKHIPIIMLTAAGNREDIVAGIYFSVVSRTISLCKRVGIEKDVAVTGGVALNDGLVGILEQELGFEVLKPESPQIIAALGAAIVARENAEKGTQ